jgi:hypothetical protein
MATVTKLKPAFPLTFNNVKRDPDERQIDNILERDEGDYSQKSISDLVKSVDTGSNVEFNAAKLRYQKLNVLFDPANFPVAAMIPVGLCTSDEDIQRELDVPHATHIYSYFDEQRVQAIQVIKTPGKEEYTIVNGQHTATSIALIVASGLMKGWKAKDWKKFPVTVTYIETDDRSKARETFALLNGEMSKEISTFDHWKQHYLSVRLDKSGNPAYLHTYKLIQLLKQYNCVPLPTGHEDAGLPGAVTHLDAVETAAKNDDYERLEFILQNHNTFWNNLPLDSAEFGFYGTLLDIAEEENILRTTKEWGQFLVDLHAVVQKVFKGMPKIKTSVSKAYKKYRYDQFFDKNASVPFSVALYVAYKVYQKLGGTFSIPKLENMYVHKNVDVIHYLSDSEIDYINNHVPAKSKLKSKPVTIPKASKAAAKKKV